MKSEFHIIALNNLANLQKVKKEFGKAELSYLEALEIYRKLADENPQAYLADFELNEDRNKIIQFYSILQMERIYRITTQ